MKFFLAALATAFLLSVPAAHAELPKPGTVMTLPAYCKTEADVMQMADIIIANDGAALRAFLSDPANSCIVLSSVGRDPIRAVLISVKRYKNGMLIGKLRVGKDIIYAFGRE